MERMTLCITIITKDKHLTPRREIGFTLLYTVYTGYKEGCSPSHMSDVSGNTMNISPNAAVNTTWVSRVQHTVNLPASSVSRCIRSDTRVPSRSSNNTKVNTCYWWVEVVEFPGTVPQSDLSRRRSLLYCLTLTLVWLFGSLPSWTERSQLFNH